jgi:hypothetical protein
VLAIARLWGVQIPLSAPYFRIKTRQTTLLDRIRETGTLMTALASYPRAYRCAAIPRISYPASPGGMNRVLVAGCFPEFSNPLKITRSAVESREGMIHSQERQSGWARERLVSAIGCKTKFRELLPSTGFGVGRRPSSDRSASPHMAISTRSVISFLYQRRRRADILGISPQTLKMIPAVWRCGFPKRSRSLCGKGPTVTSGDNQTWV